MTVKILPCARRLSRRKNVACYFLVKPHCRAEGVAMHSLLRVSVCLSPCWRSSRGAYDFFCVLQSSRDAYNFFCVSEISGTAAFSWSCRLSHLIVTSDEIADRRALFNTDKATRIRPRRHICGQECRIRKGRSSREAGSRAGGIELSRGPVKHAAMLAPLCGGGQAAANLSQQRVLHFASALCIL